jgi:hypothetical protein
VTYWDNDDYQNAKPAQSSNENIMLRHHLLGSVLGCCSALVVDQNYEVQARGRSLLPLRCTEVEGGFLGKTLLTLIYNRGGSIDDPPLLPTHKLGPHDIVAISSASGQQSVAKEAIAQGVVYRVQDTKLVIAVDELDDSASLDVPLRLDKLANKVLLSVVCCSRSMAYLLICEAVAALFVAIVRSELNAFAATRESLLPILTGLEREFHSIL